MVERQGRGYVESVVGGLLGGILGYFVGGAVSRATAVGDLSDIATGLLWIFVMFSIGLSVGCGVALRLRSRDRAVRTAFLALPTIFLGLVLLVPALSVLDAVPGVGWVAVFGIPIASLLLARRLSFFG